MALFKGRIKLEHLTPELREILTSIIQGGGATPPEGGTSTGIILSNSTVLAESEPDINPEGAVWLDPLEKV